MNEKTDYLFKINTKKNQMKNQTKNWTSTWNRVLPYFALIGPTSLIIIFLFSAQEIGKGFVSSARDSPLQSIILTFIFDLVSLFFLTTFIFLGQTLSKVFLKVGILVTILGILGIHSIESFYSTAEMQNKMIESIFISDRSILDKISVWQLLFIPFVYIYMFAIPLSFIIGGIAIMMTNLAPKWVGILLAICYPIILTGQFIIGRELGGSVTTIGVAIMTLGTVFMTLAILGLFKALRKNSTNAHQGIDKSGAEVHI